MVQTIKKPARKTIVLPIGRASYPFLAKPDSGREYSDDTWKVDYLIPKASWEKASQKVEEAILEVAREFFTTPNMLFGEIKKHPVKDLALDPKVDPKMRDYVMLRVKNRNSQPLIVDVNKKEMSQDAIAKIKGGDWIEAIVTFFPYSQSGGGISAGLDVVRFIRAGEAFGMGASRHLGLLEDIEITADEFTDEEMAQMVKSA